MVHSQDEVLEVQLAKGIKEFVEHAMITLWKPKNEKEIY